MVTAVFKTSIMILSNQVFDRWTFENWH